MTNKPYTRLGYTPSNYSSSDFTPAEFSDHPYAEVSYTGAEFDGGTEAKDMLLGKINRKDANVAVLGLGYVGLPLAIEFTAAGFKTLGVDVSPSLVKSLSEGKSHVEDISDTQLGRAIDSGLRFSCNYDDLRDVDCISIAVPTPLTKTKEPDISYINSAIQALSAVLKSETLVILESTTWPGTTDELVAAKLLASRGLVAGKDVFIAFSPERVDPGNPVWKIKNTPKVIGGVTPACTEVAAALYNRVIDKIHVVQSAREAEMVKLLENTFRAVNIGLVNELLLMCQRMNIDVWNVIDAASTKPFGFMAFSPGPGIGGHCIPLDPVYLSWKAKTVDFYNRFIELATDINGNMPRFVINRLTELLNDRQKCVKGSNIAVLGIGYKKNVSDMRESPGLEVMALLKQKHAVVYFCDPLIPALEGETRVETAQLESMDALVLATDHDAFDYEAIANLAPLILDCRNGFARRGIQKSTIVKL